LAWAAAVSPRDVATAAVVTVAEGAASPTAAVVTAAGNAALVTTPFHSCRGSVASTGSEKRSN